MGLGERDTALKDWDCKIGIERPDTCNLQESGFTDEEMQAFTEVTAVNKEEG